MRFHPKDVHEVRDPVHGFIRFDALERQVIDLPPVQRLKSIRQLAMTYQVYPGATHCRFEHALGVMELAGRAFDSLLAEEKQAWGAAWLPETTDPERRDYWRRALRLAALLHDVGHLPFSHAAERGLLPPGETHEHLTRALILQPPVAEVLSGAAAAVRPQDVVKLALSPRNQPETDLTPWEAILNEVVTGDTFGVDRMDYLLRDSHHVGVPYGRFDPLRLLDNLVVLARPGEDGAPPDESPEQLTLGVHQAGIHGAEALLLARYFMFSQVYYHHVRRAYDAHLEDFMRAWLGPAGYPAGTDGHLALTDSEVLAALRAAAADPALPGHDPARRIQQRDHFRLAYRVRRADLRLEAGGHPAAPVLFQRALAARFEPTAVRVESQLPTVDSNEILVLRDDGRVVSGRAESEALAAVPNAWFGYVFATKEFARPVAEYLEEYRTTILELGPG
jgi:HD superfamily phosphohydrolase